MFGGKSLALVRSFQIQFPLWKVTVSPFAVWSAHAGWIVTSALVGLIVTIQVMGSLVVQGEYPDPFAHYDAISPGNSTQALSEYPCAISQSRSNGQLVPSHFSCAIFPQDGYFDIIHVEGRDNEITELTFYATKVTLGQLALHWKPAFRPQSTEETMVWNNRFYRLEVVGSKLDYQISIRMFTVKILQSHEPVNFHS